MSYKSTMTHGNMLILAMAALVRKVFVFRVAQLLFLPWSATWMGMLLGCVSESVTE